MTGTQRTLCPVHHKKKADMPNWLRALIAGYGAKKLGGGCFGTIIVFIIIYYALGQCNRGTAVRNVQLETKSHNQTAHVPAVDRTKSVQFK